MTGTGDRKWGVRDLPGAAFVFLFLVPPLGLAIALCWLAYEAWQVLNNMLRAARHEAGTFWKGLARLPRDFFRDIREWFSASPPATAQPPTEDRGAAAKRRYEERLRLLADAKLDAMELAAGREKAKQQYLRDLDEAMK